MKMLLTRLRALPCRIVVMALGSVSLVALIFALISQYAFGYAPCELCITQRWWHGIIVSFGILAFLRPWILDEVRWIPSHIAFAPIYLLSLLVSWRLWLLLLLQTLAIGTCFAFAIDHIGVEQHWWHGTAACVGPKGAKSIADLTAQIMNTPVTRCDEPTWFFLGLSMAVWNAILTCLMLLAALTRLVKKDAAPLPAG